MLKIVIPLAGSSDLFNNAGYYYPKPLTEIGGKTMIELVLQNPSTILRKYQFIFIIKAEEANKFHLDNTLKLLHPDCSIIKLKKTTKGGLCSVLMAIDQVDSTDSLLILNGDQIIDANFDEVDKYWHTNNVDAGLIVFKSVHPRWSYARVEGDEVVQTAEKNPISHNAIAGYYYFRQASDFFDAAFETIKNDAQLDGNFYISSVINEYILRIKKVNVYSIESAAYHSFYSPQMVIDYERRAR